MAARIDLKGGREARKRAIWLFHTQFPLPGRKIRWPPDADIVYRQFTIAFPTGMTIRRLISCPFQSLCNLIHPQISRERGFSGSPDLAHADLEWTIEINSLQVKAYDNPPI